MKPPGHAPRSFPYASHRGVVSLLFALLLPVLLGLGAFAIDYPHLLATRAELQITADAAALAGARYLGEGGVLNMDTAVAQAQAALAYNHVAGQPIVDASIQGGYWDISSAHAGLQLLPITPTATDIPALRVSLSRSAGHNTGEVGTVFAKFLGLQSMPISVTAVAARAGASTIGGYVLFPLVFSQCMYNQYWNSQSSPPGPRLDAKGNPYIFQIGAKTDTGCSVNGIKFPTGAWAATASKDLSSSTLTALVTSRLAESLSIGDSIFVNAGNFTQQLYTAVNSCSAAAPVAKQTCRYVQVGVVGAGAATGANTLVGFACIEILSAKGGSSNYVEASMSTKCPTPPSSGVGPNYGVTTPSKLFF